MSDFPRGCNPIGEQEALPKDVNFFKRAFPCLFPYGRGGLEALRPVEVKLRDHIRWALQYHDKRFGKHPTLPFVLFGIQQRREVLASAQIQMQRKNFDRDARIIANISMSKLKQVCAEEEKRKPISDSSVRLLSKHVHATGVHVPGSDQQRQQLRLQIWSMCISLGPPNSWVTINPSDLHDPIAQVFAGEDIDLNNFIRHAGPNKDQRATNIAGDPVAASQFFHFTVKTILEKLFQVWVVGNRVKSGMGILGRISAYFGVIESQGRGTLHIHMLLWLMNAPTGDEMIELLKSEDFRQHIVAYIKANLRAYVPGLKSAASVKSIPTEKDIAWNRPRILQRMIMKPQSSHFNEDLQEPNKYTHAISDVV